jgi:hypothetical protein
VNPIPKPRPNPETSSADVAERGVASMGVRSSGNLCVEEGRRARILLHLHVQLEGTVLRGSRAGQRCGCRNHPSCAHG